MCGRNCQPCQRCQQPNTSSRISASGVKDADFVESFLRRWHSRSCFRIDGQKIYREPKGEDSAKDVQISPYPTRPQTEALSGTAILDRKSTRLNSSHPSISYAVFCLKK